MKRSCIILVLLLSYVYAMGQEVAINRVIEKIYSQLMETSESEIDYSDLYDDLIAFSEHPINLNKTTPEQLSQLRFLSDIQIENFFYYLYKAGSMRTIYELQLVEGMDLFTIQLLAPFVTVGSSEDVLNSWKFRDVMRASQHELIARFDGTFEPKQGSLPNATQSYLGDPFYTSLKYRLKSSDKLQFGLTAEKDAGEPFYGPYNTGYDSYSGFLQINQLWKFSSIVVGDYRANFGQGLVMQQDMSPSKSSLVTNVTTRSQGLKRHASTDEYNFLRGVGATVALGDFKLSAFYSFRQMDADTSGGSFSSFKTDGLHRLAADFEKKRTVNRQLVGGNVTYRHRFFRLGLTATQTWLNVPLNYQPAPYQLYYFRGQSQFAGSVDYLFAWHGFQFFGETAINNVGGVATLNGILFAPISVLNLVVLQRYYSKKYDVFFANAFSEGSRTNNENGLYIGAELKPVRKWKVAAYADLFHSPWLTYQVNKPASGYETLLQVDYMPSRQVEMYGRFRFEQKEKNVTSIDLQPTTLVSDIQKSSLRYTISYQVLGVGFKNVVEWNCARLDADQTFGFLMTQDVAYTLPWIDLTLAMRYEFFDAPAYENRFYVYERDVPYASYTPALYGVGNRWYINLDYQITSRLTLYMRVAQTYYTDNRLQFGTGAETIQGRHRTDFRAHLQWKI